MGGLFGCVSKSDCVNDLFYGTDYHSHLGTRRGGLAGRESVRHDDAGQAVTIAPVSFFRKKRNTLVREALFRTRLRPSCQEKEHRWNPT